MKKPKSKKPTPIKAVAKPKSGANQSSDQGGLTEIREDIEQALEGVVQRNKKGEVVETLVQIVSQEMYSGPIPHPRHLKAYEDVCPGAADRILRMAEKSQEAQLEIPGKMIAAESKYRNKGLLFGFLTLALLVIAALSCVYMGHPKTAALFLAAGAVGVVGRFIDGRRNRGKDDDDI